MVTSIPAMTTHGDSFQPFTILLTSWMKLLISPWILLCAVAVLRMVRPRSNHNKPQQSFYTAWLQELLTSILFWLLLWPYPTLQKSSIIPWWGPLNRLVSQWPVLFPKAPAMLRHGGPLGTGCAKLTEVLTGMLLWRIHSRPSLVLWGPDFSLADTTVWLGVALLCLVVNAVLHLWSMSMKSRGDHSGVNDMVSSTQGRSLHIQEKLGIFGLACLNGTVEEITSRCFWMAEFQSAFVEQATAAGTLSKTHPYHPHYANLAQAIVFGLWHYHGIPSGWTGGGLTFVYGGIMGLLYQFGQGLFLPIVVHTMADYYIFAIIARRQGLVEKKPKTM
jgi:hypothetical protein